MSDQNNEPMKGATSTSAGTAAQSVTLFGGVTQENIEAIRDILSLPPTVSFDPERMFNLAQLEEDGKQEKKFADQVAALVKPGEDIVRALLDDPEKAHLWHMATGVAGEAGELIDAVKKHVVYGKPLDLENVKEELGDLEFYMESIRQTLGFTRAEVLAHNYAKLGKRYAQKVYTDQAAIDRKDKEQ